MAVTLIFSYYRIRIGFGSINKSNVLYHASVAARIFKPQLLVITQLVSAKRCRYLNALYFNFEQGLPSSLMLENSEGDRFLLLPSATLPGRPESKVL